MTDRSAHEMVEDATKILNVYQFNSWRPTTGGVFLSSRRRTFILGGRWSRILGCAMPDSMMASAICESR
jgi:hypothetical protein